MIHIYLITNLLNGKQYVGQTRQALRRRFRSHYTDQHAGQTAIGRALRKYGHNNFEIKLLVTCATQEQANEAEQSWIECLGTISPNGYNLRQGGAHGAMPETAKRKLRGRVIAWKDKLHGPKTPEHRKKLSEAARNRKVTASQKAALTAYGRRVSKGEYAGEKNPRALLNASQVQEIRRLLREGKLSQEKIGKTFGVKQVTISAIKRKVTWNSLPDEV